MRVRNCGSMAAYGFLNACNSILQKFQLDYNIGMFHQRFAYPLLHVILWCSIFCHWYCLPYKMNLPQYNSQVLLTDCVYSLLSRNCTQNFNVVRLCSGIHDFLFSSPLTLLCLHAFPTSYLKTALKSSDS